MAKLKRSKSGQFTKGSSRVQVIRTPAPIVRVSAPRAAPKKARRGRRRSTMLGGFGGTGIKGLVGYGLGGFLYGIAVKQGFVAKLPAIPIIGRTGTAAIALDYFSRHGGGELAGKAARAAAVLSGYQLGMEGHITGDDTAGLATMGMDTMGDSYTEGEDTSSGEFAEGEFTEGDEA